MSIKQGIWKVSEERAQELKPSALANENLLEEQIMQDISILNKDWLLVGRQVRTAYDKYIDLLAMDANGSIIIIELKKDKTPRDVIAQTIDYASWVTTLVDSDIADIYLRFAEQYTLHEQSLDSAFEAKFRVSLDDVAINESHQMVVVATELDASTERIINYLNDFAQISINALFFAAFEDQGNTYLSRAWMIDPVENQERAVSKTRKEPWNGEFYTSFGDNRPWEDARRLGFIAAGGGSWYSNTLGMLTEGDRVWVNIPKTGYVGVGIVIGERARADEFKFETENGPKTLFEIDTKEDYRHLISNANDESAEYIVPIKWLHTVNRQEAVSEVGLFGNQNTVCKPTAPKWSHTVNRLKQAWKIN